MLKSFDAGLLNSYNSKEAWWDYIRGLLDAAHEHYEAEYDATIAEKDARIEELEQYEPSDEDNDRINELESDLEVMRDEVSSLTSQLDDIKKAMGKIQDIADDHT
jgi:DNA repair exonuclease SbcCD ATPase subunit